MESFEAITGTKPITENDLLAYDPKKLKFSEHKGVGKKDTYTFDSTSRLQSILNRISNQSMTADDANMMQDRHYDMYNQWNQRPVEGNIVSSYQSDYQSLGLNDEIIAPKYSDNYNIQSTNPNSGDSQAKKWTSDGIYDQITDDRRVMARASDYTDQSKLQSDIELAKKSGYEYYLDPNTQYYKLRRLGNRSLEEGSTATDRVISVDSQDPKKSSGSIFSQLLDNPTLMYGLPRAIYADRMNRKMTDLAKDALSPLLKDPLEVHRYTRSDLDAEMQGERNYADVRRMVSRPITSDANLQTAAQLQAEIQGQAARTAGKEKAIRL